jgi:hypothetical protein
MLQKYKVGDTIGVLANGNTLPGTKQLKVGDYVITKFRKSFTSSDMVYDFKSVRKNSKYEFAYTQKWLEDNSILK